MDGVFLVEQPYDTYMKGEQADVPLLVGRNTMEAPVTDILGGKAPTVESLREAMAKVYGLDNVDRLLSLYGIATDADVRGEAGASVSSDIFIAFSSWLWAELQKTAGTKPVWFYQFRHPRPATEVEKEAEFEVFRGARHSIDIEYAMGNLPTNLVYSWQSDDYTVSSIFQGYYLNFIEKGDPNGLGLTGWDPVNGSDVTPTLQLDVQCRMTADTLSNRKNLYIRDFWFPGK